MEIRCFYKNLKIKPLNTVLLLKRRLYKFLISKEIYFEPYLKYLSDDLTLDAFIAEADRKLSAYLNE